MLAPIALFVYNRPQHTIQTIEALLRNKESRESTLHIFADGPKQGANEETLNKIAEVREIIHHIKGFQSVILHLSDTNKGCARSVREGITEVVQQYGRIIVVEDDIVPVSQFLSYLNRALDIFQHRKDIWAVGGHGLFLQIPETYTSKHDLYLVHRSNSSGWATWSDRWNNIDWEVRDAEKFFSKKSAVRRFDRGGEGMSQMLKDQLDGKIDAWDIVWDYHIYKHNGYCIYPIKAFCTNIGLDGSGTHCEENEPLPSAPLFDPRNDSLRIEAGLRPNREVQRIFFNYWTDNPILPFSTRIKRIIKKILRQWGIMKQPQ